MNCDNYINVKKCQNLQLQIQIKLPGYRPNETIEQTRIGNSQKYREPSLGKTTKRKKKKRKEKKQQKNIKMKTVKKDLIVIFFF